MSYRDRETLFIFFDESGNFDFSANGTKFWSLTALCTFHPLEGREAFHDLSYSLCDEGIGQECFHATEDRQEIRDSVFSLILGIPKSFDVHCSLAYKRKVPPAIRETDVTFYSYMCKRTLRYLLSLEKYKSAKRVVVVFSSIFTKGKHEKLIGELKIDLKEFLEIPSWIYFRGTQYDVNCQIADYCCWAIYIKWDRNECRSHAIIANQIISETHLFDVTGTSYY
jgi:hypothetical protein